jgi:PAS domain S-box-containing protein
LRNEFSFRREKLKAHFRLFWPSTQSTANVIDFLAESLKGQNRPASLENTWRRRQTMNSMASHAVVMANNEGVIHLWSQGAELLFGYEAAQAVGQRLDLIIPHAYRERHWKGFFAAMRTGLIEDEGGAFQSPVLCRDGQIRTFPARLFLLRDARDDQKPIGALALFSPIDALNPPDLHSGLTDS